MYGESFGVVKNGVENSEHTITVDLRSDTVTKPCRAMRQAMFDAEVGDGVCGEDPTVIKLEKYVADLVGKEAALFVTSGTMGNLISTMVHCNTRGCELYAGEDSHMVRLEQGGPSQIANVVLCTLPNKPDGTFDLKKLERKLRDSNDPHTPISRMIVIENTMNGKILPKSWIDEVVVFGRKHGLKLHMDGARLWNASIGSGIPASEIVAGMDSVTFCLSKALGAPIGSMLCGTSDFILQARRSRKVLGGDMRQVGVIASAGLMGFQNLGKLHIDHSRAAATMNTINSVGSKLVYVDPINAQTNMVIVSIKETEDITALSFARRLGEIIDAHEDDDIKVLAWAIAPEIVRLVFHLDITEEMFEAAQRKIRYIIKKMDPAFH